MSQLIIGIVIVALVGVYFWLRRSQHNDKNLPVVSEDVNLPMSQPAPQTEQPTPPSNEQQPPQQPL